MLYVRKRPPVKTKNPPQPRVADHDIKYSLQWSLSDKRQRRNKLHDEQNKSDGHCCKDRKSFTGELNEPTTITIQQILERKSFTKLATTTSNIDEHMLRPKPGTGEETIRGSDGALMPYGRL